MNGSGNCMRRGVFFWLGKILWGTCCGIYVVIVGAVPKDVSSGTSNYIEKGFKIPLSLGVGYEPVLSMI